MAVTLLSSAVGQNTAKKQAMVDIFARQNPLIQRIPVTPIPNNTLIYQYNREKSLPATAARAIGATYTATQAEYEKKQTQLQTFGGKFTLDRKLNVPEEITRQTNARLKSGAASLQAYIFDGDASSGEFDGINQICSDESQETTAATNGLAVLDSTGANAKTLFQKFIDVVDAVDGDNIEDPADFMGLVWLMSYKMHMVLNAAANLVTNVQFGKSEILGLPTLYNIPIIYVTKNSSNSDILGFDETVGSGTDCGSIYLANFSNENGLAVVAHGTNVAEMETDYVRENAETHTYLQEMTCGLVALRTNCVHRLKGIRNAAS